MKDIKRYPLGTRYRLENSNWKTVVAVYESGYDFEIDGKNIVFSSRWVDGWLSDKRTEIILPKSAEAVDFYNRIK